MKHVSKAEPSDRSWCQSIERAPRDRELHVRCYRILGSFDESEDLGTALSSRFLGLSVLLR